MNYLIVMKFLLSFEAKSEPGIRHKGIFYSKNNWIVHFKLLWPERGQKRKEDKESIKISDSTTGCTLDGIKTEEQIETFTVVAKPWFQGYEATLNPQHPKVSLQIKTNNYIHKKIICKYTNNCFTHNYCMQYDLPTLSICDKKGIFISISLWNRTE